jgi:peptidoglycan-associated lipoprotein
MDKRTTVVGSMLLCACVVFFTGCGGKKTSSIKDLSSDFRDVNPFADDSSGDGFGEAAYSEKLKKKIAEALKPVYFEYDSYRLTNDAIRQLGKVVRLLQEESKLRIIIQGHCDERGSSEYNVGLGELRAMVIREYLATYGIKNIRIETISFGREMPAHRGCNSEKCHALNRRGEFKVIAK